MASSCGRLTAEPRSEMRMLEPADRMACARASTYACSANAVLASILIRFASGSAARCKGTVIGLRQPPVTGAGAGGVCGPGIGIKLRRSLDGNTKFSHVHSTPYAPHFLSQQLYVGSLGRRDRDRIRRCRKCGTPVGRALEVVHGRGRWPHHHVAVVAVRARRDGLND
eukprot:6200848-Pleurochrysis_carterae.AAC.2